MTFETSMIPHSDYLTSTLHTFDHQFSGKKLERACTVTWIVLKTGLCCVRLSESLLKLRRRRDLVETLLYEMIHAYLFVTGGAMFMDRDG
ncbi:SprT-like domain-containing protein [Meloidogyne graminicola]|uniref:SprT-like domain-containing protein n=1 Tax=Meloidogyne graminicola TaxID=189291 RepID=A0A8S9ZG04_9BILA|nr:SprT-like domain-containing protein [Meloidogyne graminicola]